ncbi:MAG: hypothetical protein JKY50_01015 [Oleispira sp.]|nr:hypothetical protein [Oleispira sp.]
MTELEKEKVLLSFSIEPDHSKATLDRYLTQYPDLASEILDLAHEIDLVEIANEVSEGEKLTLKNVLSGESLNTLSNRMSLPKDFLMGFRDRLIRLETIPQGFLRKLSTALDREISQVVMLLAQPSGSKPRQAFKAIGRPQDMEQMTFNDFVDQSGLDEATRLSLKDGGERHEFD